MDEDQFMGHCQKVIDELKKIRVMMVVMVALLVIFFLLQGLTTFFSLF